MDEEDEIFHEDDDNDLGSRRNASFAQGIFLAEEEEAFESKNEAAACAPFQPNFDTTQQRPGYQVIDNVSYYGIASLIILL